MTVRKSFFGAIVGFALLLAFSMPASAQSGKITGIVTDQQTGEPLAGAQVFLEGTGLGQLTNDDGRYFLVNVEPGDYTLVAQLIGYATVRREGVQVTIDATITQNFDLPSEAVAVDDILVEAERVPLVQQGQTGSSDLITAAEINALPVTDIAGVLSLEQGFINVPVDNTDVVSYAQQRQGVTPFRIRGGRGAETTVLIDGIPINNFVLGGPAFDITNQAIEQVSFLKGHFPAQYGNALSGVINYATREGGRDFEGQLEYRTSSFGSWLGNDYDDTRGFDMGEGYVSGPVPGTNEDLRFIIAARQSYGAHAAYEFDNDIFRPGQPSDATLTPHQLDVVPGWRSFGYNERRDAYGKLTYFATPAAKVNLSYVTYRRQNQPFDFDFMLNVDPLDFQETRADSAYYLARPGLLEYQDLVMSSLSLERDLYIASWDHTLGNTAYEITAGYFDQSRETCNYMSGTCLENRFEDPNFSGGFVAPGPAPYANTPTTGTDFFYGGESLKTYTGRFDIESQVSDHHNLSAGVFFQQHDMTYDEWENRGTNDVLLVRQFYEAEPWDGAVYLEDKIEYDFITVELGARFDYGKAAGEFFANPVDPFNGTTAFDVCANPGNWQNRQVHDIQISDGDTTVVPTEMSADLSWTEQSCGDVDVRNEAAQIATADDFAEADARTQFSPRIGVSVPVTESSNLFFNFGRYSQNPILRNTYQNTGIGTDLEGTVAGPTIESTLYDAAFIGNPHLMTEQATTYEVGYTQAIDDQYALSAVVYSKDQSGLTGIAQVGSPPYQVNDPGATYGTTNPEYAILLNKDFATTRGFETSLRRRVQDYWGFDLNYGYMKCRANSADPAREFERVDQEGDPEIRREIPCEIDQPHTFSGVLRFAVGQDAPNVPFGNWLRNSNLTLTARANSGFPYTPTLSFSGIGNQNQLERFSARAPSTFSMNMYMRKDFSINNLRYGAFVSINNLTDAENCTQVYPTSGECVGGAEDQSRRRQGNPISASQSTFFDRPQYLAPGRSFDAGIRVAF